MFIIDIFRSLFTGIRAIFVAETWIGTAAKTVACIVGFMIPFAFVIVWPVLSQHGIGVLIKRKARRIAEEKGVSMDRYIEGGRTGAIIDKNKSTITFVTLNEHWEIAFDQIRGLEWEWVDRNGRKTNNHLVFLTNDEKNPLYKVGSLGSGEAQEWQNRLELALQLR